MEELFDNIYVLSFYGWLIYTFLMFVTTKDKKDEANGKFNYKKYLKKNWDNWVLSLLFVPIIAYKAEEIFASVMAYLEKDWTFYDLYYLGVGVLVEAFYFAIAWILKKKRQMKSN